MSDSNTDADAMPLCRTEVAATSELLADKSDSCAAEDSAASAVEMDVTPIARSDAVAEMLADAVLCVLWLNEMNADTSIDAIRLIRSDTATEMPEDSDASASCSVEAAVDRDADTEATAPVAGAGAMTASGSTDVGALFVPLGMAWRVRRGEGAFKFSRTIRREPSIMMPALVAGRVISAIVLLLPNNPPTKTPMEAPALPVKKIAPFWLVDALRAPNELSFATK